MWNLVSEDLDLLVKTDLVEILFSILVLLVFDYMLLYALSVRFFQQSYIPVTF